LQARFAIANFQRDKKEMIKECTKNLLKQNLMFLINEIIKKALQILLLLQKKRWHTI